MNRPSTIHALGHSAEAAYDRFLINQGTDMVKALINFEEKVHQSSFKYGRFAIPTFFKPYFLSAKQEKFLKENIELMNQVLEKVIHVYFQNKEVKELLCPSKDAEKIIAIDPGYETQIQIARYDCFCEGSNLKFIEMNTDAPAGMGYADLLENILFKTPHLAEYFEEFHFRRELRAKKLLEALLKAYGQFKGGGSKHPRIAIMDWRTVKTKSEFEVLKAFFEEQGYPTCVVDPRDLKLKQGKLFYDDFQIDLIYRRSIAYELIERQDEVKDFLKAYKTQAVCVVNPLRTCLVANNRVLSLLTNPKYDSFFTEEENKLKLERIPWTRKMYDAERFYGSKNVYLIDFLKDERETLVLKPSKDSEIKDVVIGADAVEDVWNKTIDRALKNNWVMQEMLRAPQQSVPILMNERIEFVLKKVSINPFTFNGKYSPGLARLSDENSLKISKGGGLIPCLREEQTHNR